jgi:hypothetical protein
LLCNAARQLYAGRKKKEYKSSVPAHKTTIGSFVEILEDKVTILK